MAGHAPASDLPLRCLTIDVEDYYHIEAARQVIGRRQWSDQPGRVQRNVDLLLELFSRCGVIGTFFVLGDAAQRFPQMVKRIAAAGHEIASHGWGHDRLHRLDPQRMRIDVLKSKHMLEDQVGCTVKGYRAPTFSLVPVTAWAIDVLLEAGFEYDASVFPVVHPLYGVPAAPSEPFYVQARRGGGALLEIPPLTWRVLGRNLAVAGGGYFRLLPQWFMNRGLQQAAAQRRPAVLYFHPWEFDPQMPRMPLSWTGRIRTYTGLKSAAARLERVMRQQAHWLPLGAALETLRRYADAAAPICLTDLATGAA